MYDTLQSAYHERQTDAGTINFNNTDEKQLFCNIINVGSLNEFDTLDHGILLLRLRNIMVSLMVQM